jgi:hypothetical protein
MVTYAARRAAAPRTTATNGADTRRVKVASDPPPRLARKTTRERSPWASIFTESSPWALEMRSTRGTELPVGRCAPEAGADDLICFAGRSMRRPAVVSVKRGALVAQVSATTALGPILVVPRVCACTKRFPQRPRTRRVASPAAEPVSIRSGWRGTSAGPTSWEIPGADAWRLPRPSVRNRTCPLPLRRALAIPLRSG